MRSSPASLRCIMPAARRAVRVPLADFAFCVASALDFGAEAIVAPMINTVADAKQFVNAAKYPPLGERSCEGPQRAMVLQGKSECRSITCARPMTATLTLAMIETQTALGNAEAIAATPGIDALFVVPYDLSTALKQRARRRTASTRSGGRPRHRPDLCAAVEQGRQDSRHLLPRRRARLGHGQARLSLHRRRQRSRPGARRRGGAGEGRSA